MRWRKEGPYLSISDAGYKCARYRVDGVDWFRPSYRDKFIGAPVQDARAASAECELHFKQARA